MGVAIVPVHSDYDSDDSSDDSDDSPKPHDNNNDDWLWYKYA
jgi:hypothetical protein